MNLPKTSSLSTMQSRMKGTTYNTKITFSEVRLITVIMMDNLARPKFSPNLILSYSLMYRHSRCKGGIPFSFKKSHRLIRSLLIINLVTIQFNMQKRKMHINRTSLCAKPDEPKDLNIVVTVE
jgi:hypothetical protein